MAIKKSKKWIVPVLLCFCLLAGCYQQPPKQKAVTENTDLEPFLKKFKTLPLPLLESDFFVMQAGKPITQPEISRYELSKQDSLWTIGKVYDTRKFSGIICQEKIPHGKQTRLTTLAKDGRKISQLLLTKEVQAEGMDDWRAEITNNMHIFVTHRHFTANGDAVAKTRMEYLLGENGVIGLLTQKTDTLPLE